MLLLLFLFVFDSTKAVQLSVVAPWYEIPVFEQIVSFLNRYSQRSTFNFLTTVLKEHDKLENKGFLLSTASNCVNTLVFRQLVAHLDVGSQIPRAMFNGYENITDQHENMTLQTDIVFGIGSSPYIVNIYIKKNTEKILSLLNNQKDLTIRFVLPPKNLKVKLRGYGFEMRPFKYSMEYGVKNTIKTGESDTTSQLFEDRTISEIPQITNNNISSIDFNESDIKFAAYIAKTPKESRIQKLQSITNNWPLYLADIMSQNTDSTDINQIRYFLNERDHAASVNGRHISAKNLDIFTLLNIIDEEQVMRDVLKEQFNFSKERIDAFSSTSYPDETKIHLDFDSKYVHFFNDLKTDPIYNDWSNDISLIHMYKHKVPEIRENMVNIISYLDPSTPKGLSQFGDPFSMVQRLFPIRYGIVPYFNFGNALSRKIGFAFHHISRIIGDKRAMIFLMKAFQLSMSESGEISEILEINFINAYTNSIKGSKCVKWSEIPMYLNPYSQEFQIISETHKYLKELGIKLGSISVNGLVQKIPTQIYDYYSIVYHTFEYLSVMIRTLGAKDIPSPSILSVIKMFHLVVPTIDNDVYLGKVKSYNLLKYSKDHQIDFIDSMNRIKWEEGYDKECDTYVFLFCKPDDNINIFQSFIKESHISRIKFAINPDVVEFKFKEEQLPALVINGRIFERLNLSDIDKLRRIDGWNNKFTAIHVSDFSNNELESFYLATIVNNWRLHSAKRQHESSVYQLDDPLVISTNQSEINLSLIINPFSREFQRISSILNFLSESRVVALHLVLNPTSNHNSFLSVVGSYYRMALDSDSIVFSHLAEGTTYSALPDVASSWVIESLYSPFDLDNIVLDDLPTGLSRAEYILTNTIIEGYCTNAKGSVISNGKDRTTVMRYHGYFQLPAKPGLNLIEGKKIEFNSFGARYHHIHIKDKQIPPIKPNFNEDRVDIFAVASGRLYEQLVRIMMLSAKRHTNASLTFWMLGNYLSPQFKASMSEMAKTYGFNYKFVKYKWPNWLFAQVEKQRIIWANKILFLDVLFPPELNRVIYVDSDQIIRTDMRELMNMDFKGAPYAFTPFCNSRKETEPYRFWKTGYWKRHLGDLNYHISALFAIDLPRFRELKAADILRKYYQKLAPDGQSLANLDQDLPNFAQKILPIYSLPQNWLWCETWCSDDTMDQAKTIDLCNNPLTHVPKLEIAMKRVREWPPMNDEVAKYVAADDEYQRAFFTN